MFILLALPPMADEYEIKLYGPYPTYETAVAAGRKFEEADWVWFVREPAALEEQ